MGVRRIKPSFWSVNPALVQKGWAQDFWRGLDWGFMLAEKGGTAVQNLVRGGPGGTIKGGPIWEGDRYGMALKTTDAQDGHRIELDKTPAAALLDQLAAGDSRFSLAVLYFRRSDPVGSGEGYLWDAGYEQDTGPWGLIDTDDESIALGTNDGTINLTLGSGAALVANLALNALIVTVNGTAVNFYNMVNLSDFRSASGTINQEATRDYTATAGPYLHNKVDDNFRQHFIDLYMGFYWQGRVIPESLAREWGQDPYAPVRRQRRVIGRVPVAPPAAAPYYYRELIGYPTS